MRQFFRQFCPDSRKAEKYPSSQISPFQYFLRKDGCPRNNLRTLILFRVFTLILIKYLGGKDTRIWTRSAATSNSSIMNSCSSSISLKSSFARLLQIFLPEQFLTIFRTPYQMIYSQSYTAWLALRNPMRYILTYNRLGGIGRLSVFQFPL